MKLIVREGAAIPSFTCGAKSFEYALIKSMMNEQIWIWSISLTLLTGENRSIRRRKSSRATLFTIFPRQRHSIHHVSYAAPLCSPCILRSATLFTMYPTQRHSVHHGSYAAPLCSPCNLRSATLFTMYPTQRHSVHHVSYAEYNNWEREHPEWEDDKPLDLWHSPPDFDS